MAVTHSYQFTVVSHTRTLWSTLGIVFGGMALLFTGLSLKLPEVWVIVISVTAMLAGIIFMLRWIHRAESITLSADRLQSALYGEIMLADIVKTSAPWYGIPPSLKVRLRNGKSHVWGLNSSKSAIPPTATDLADLTAFILQLQLQLSSSQQTTTSIPGGGSVSKTPAPTPTSTGGVPVNKFSQWVNQPAVLISLGLLIAALSVIRACVIEARRDQFRGLRTSSEKMYQINKERVRAVLAEKLKTEGAAFLYTNDTAASLALAPQINDDNPLGISLFEHSQANMDMEAFLANPDSMPIFTYLVGGDTVVTRMRAGFTGAPDSSEQQLLVRAYDPNQHIKPNYPRNNDTTTYRVFDVCWGINIKDTSNLQYAIDRSMPGMNIMLSQIRLRKTFYFYFAGRESSGISEARFKAGIRALNALLHKNKVDTSLFIYKTFNR
ncbi:hypothetical protein [Chitinophaga nivalis]|uniref:Uncharacterized protein n=1 Tax=Chitinophaga nivalis TaxID=2991709 RepID=A0ABT3IHX0_9BACT|nr:hypothetical protein [Chitinophaga nivalis]MCW3466757.1 hypothetical protein [Chitinophaga nivalis]MCW3483552.1 hypothetical protein [Chitinophaga nivalis]